MSLPARVESNKYIVCEKTPYSYEANTNEYEAKVDVNWNRNHYIDTVAITLYKCDVLGSHREHADCSLCVTREPKYQCTWCGNSCVYNETCVYGSANECPRPRIDMVSLSVVRLLRFISQTFLSNRSSHSVVLLKAEHSLQLKEVILEFVRRMFEVKFESEMYHANWLTTKFLSKLSAVPGKSIMNLWHPLKLVTMLVSPSLW